MIWPATLKEEIGDKRLLMRGGDTVEAGESLRVGAESPHEMLHIMGES